MTLFLLVEIEIASHGLPDVCAVAHQLFTAFLEKTFLWFDYNLLAMISALARINNTLLAWSFNVQMNAVVLSLFCRHFTVQSCKFFQKLL